jgi:tetratricopeptide (TPR) repeat protein
MDTDDVNKIQEIEDFLNKKMTAEDLIAFRRRLKTEPHLLEEVDIYRSLFHAVQHQSRKELKGCLMLLEEQLKSADDESVNRRTTGNTHLISWISSIAASVLLVFVMYLWITQSSNHEALFKQYYEAYPNVIAAIERGHSAKDEKTTAFLFYEREEYQQALPLLQKLIQANPEEKAYALYAGIACLETNRLEEAKNYFTQVLSKANNPFEEQGKWYLALTLIKTNEIKEAKVYLSELANQQSAYREKAANLLSAL